MVFRRGLGKDDQAFDVAQQESIPPQQALAGSQHGAGKKPIPGAYLSKAQGGAAACATRREGFPVETSARAAAVPARAARPTAASSPGHRPGHPRGAAFQPRAASRQNADAHVKRSRGNPAANNVT